MCHPFHIGSSHLVAQKQLYREDPGDASITPDPGVAKTKSAAMFFPLHTV